MPSSSKMERKARVDAEVIQRAVLRVRSQNVLLDADLADLYGVDVRALNQAVARNADRFPSDFMFKLTAKEAASLRSQSVILESDRGRNSLRSQTVTLDGGRGRHRKYLPNAFTEQGVAMLSSVLRTTACASPRHSRTIASPSDARSRFCRAPGPRTAPAVRSGLRKCRETPPQIKLPHMTR